MKQTEQKNTIEGFLLINKPTETTSFRCIAQIRRILENKKLKAGYAGTLDPFASGLLVVGIGRPATRLLHVISRWDKKYIAQAKLGQLTDTLDKTGTVTQEKSINITEQQLKKAIANLGNKYEQIPPIYSALKHKGLPLYKLARKKGKTAKELQEVLQKKSRIVCLYQLDLIHFEPPFFTVATEVSHGTYIRTLINDIAYHAGTCGTTYELTRTSVGKLPLKDAVHLTELKTPADIINRLISVEEFSSRYNN